MKFFLTRKEIEKLNKHDREIYIVSLDVEDCKAFTEKFVFNTNATEGSAVTPEEVHDLLNHNEEATNINGIKALNVAQVYS